jgi:hypothetical protein
MPVNEKQFQDIKEQLRNTNIDFNQNNINQEYDDDYDSSQEQ